MKFTPAQSGASPGYCWRLLSPSTYSSPLRRCRPLLSGGPRGPDPLCWRGKCFLVGILWSGQRFPPLRQQLGASEGRAELRGEQLGRSSRRECLPAPPSPPLPVASWETSSRISSSHDSLPSQLLVGESRAAWQTPRGLMLFHLMV